ncbi:MAG: type III-B CRISPR module-associated protein Cmr5 [Pseudanabaena sp. Salubria-1]|nr:type III-B CRISPR module-associated protein Cmr5 [Pseudanabaena sp. Salubria-1]
MSNGNPNLKLKSQSGKEQGKEVLLAKPTISSSEAKSNQSPSTATNQDAASIKSSSSQKNHRDLDRNRASAAWENIGKVDSTNTEYGSLAREMPTMIQVNGLAQTLAFLKAKKGKHHSLIFEHLSGWVCNHLNFKNGDLLENVIRIESQEYRRATSESLAYLQWLKRFSEGKIKKEEDKKP